MDTEVARTFLEIVASGSFARAAEHLHVAQTTVSARIRILENELGRSLFVRNKSGASLTAAGEQFLRYAPTFVQLWERARHQVAVPAGRQRILAIGGELSLWDPLLLDWLVWMRKSAPEIALRAEVGLAGDLTTQVASGVLDLAVVYAPQHRPELEIEFLLEDTLVLVTTGADFATSDGEDYVQVGWGPDFALHHGQRFPELANPGLFVSLGPLARTYILKVGGSGYLRWGSVRPLVESGALHRVPGAPEFPYPAYVIYGTNADKSLIGTALAGMREVAARTPPAPGPLYTA